MGLFYITDYKVLFYTIDYMRLFYIETTWDRSTY